MRPFIYGDSVHVTTLAFLQMFQGIEVRNYDARHGGTIERIPVQVTLDTKERIYYQLKHGGFKALEQQDTRLPRISIQINDIGLRTEDYTGKEQKRLLFKTDDEVKRDIQPVPITISYTVGIWAKYFEHYIQVIENIVPYFDPYATVEVKERNLDLVRELQFTLTGLSQGSNFRVSGNDVKIVRGEMTFEAKSFMYKIMSENAYDLILKAHATVIDVTTPINSTTVSISGSLPL